MSTCSLPVGQVKGDPFPHNVEFFSQLVQSPTDTDNLFHDKFYQFPRPNEFNNALHFNM